MAEFVRCNENHGCGDWGAEWHCELEKGHEGPHQVTWDDDYPYRAVYVGNPNLHQLHQPKKDVYHVTLSWTVERGVKNENSY